MYYDHELQRDKNIEVSPYLYLAFTSNQWALKHCSYPFDSGFDHGLNDQMDGVLITTPVPAKRVIDLRARATVLAAAFASEWYYTVRYKTVGFHFASYVDHRILNKRMIIAVWSL